MFSSCRYSPFRVPLINISKGAASWVLENPFRRQHVLFNPAHIEHQDETRLGFMIFGLRCT